MAAYLSDYAHFYLANVLMLVEKGEKPTEVGAAPRMLHEQ